ncbi:MAG: alpha-2-macroglobulin family protein [Bacteroidales bacterium]|nr:alpha-2-macroglobulin family protein [Bacteroidales bacterium]
MIRKKIIPFAVALLTAVLLFSCSKQNVVRVISTSFEEEVELTAPLKFRFNRDIVPDSLVNRRLTDELIKIEPDVAGKALWINTDELVFVPDIGYSPATSYKVSLTGNITRYRKRLQLKGRNEYEFHTPYLKLENQHIYWTADESTGSQILACLSLTFNYPVHPAEVFSRLEVNSDGSPLSIHPLSDEALNETVFQLENLKPEDKDLNVTFILNKGLLPQNGNIALDKNIRTDLILNSPFRLNISDLSADHDGMTGQITVNTSQKVDAGKLRKYLSIVPSVRFDLEVFRNYFIIRSSEFDAALKYTVKIAKDLPGQLGGVLKYDYEQDVSFGKLQPAIKFIDRKGMYVSAKGSKEVEIAIISIPKIRFRVIKVYENNIIQFLSSGNYYYGDDYYEDYYYEYGYSSSESLGDVIIDKTIETNDLKRLGNSRILKFDFEDRLKNYKGIYQIEAVSDEQSWIRAKRVISISDIGLIVKKGKGNISVFANSLISANPINDAGITVIGRNNQVLATLRTNPDGYARYDYSELPAPGFEPALITAKAGDDYNHIYLQQAGINTSGFDVGGKYENPSGLEAFIYGERELYRPGEIINLSAIIRDFKWGIPGQIPVILKIITPNGKTLKTIRKVLDEEGSFEASIQTMPSALTGSYSAQLFTSNEVLIGSKVIMLEEFVPDRIKVDVGLNKDELKPDEELEVSITAVNFFGPPAANRNYEVELTTGMTYFYPKENRDYHYNLHNTETYFERILRESRTDDEGKATERFLIPGSYRDMGLLQSDMYVTVFDETGRPVHRRKTVKIYTQHVFYGVKYSSYYARTGKPVVVPLIAADKEGKALDNITAEVKLVRIEYKTVLSRSGDYYRYRSEQVERVLETKKIVLNGTSVNYTFTPDLNGRYQVRVSRPGAKSYVMLSFWAYGYGGMTRYSSFQVDNEGRIDIELDKERYSAGDKAKVLLKAPFSGKILVTVENDNMIRYFYSQSDKRVASFELDIPGDYVPNVYITATLFKPHAESDLPLTVAHGFAPVMVEDPANRLPLSVEAADKSRSGTKQKIKIKSSPNTPVTIAVVDNGILQVTGYQTPDPYGFFYAKRALAVSSFDIYPYLFPEIGSAVSQAGGDEMGLEKRINPLTSKRIKLVSYWSGIIKTNSNGIAEYEIEIPQFSGELRLMAIAYKGKAFAASEKAMKVADPVVISTALPRFISPKDSVVVPVVITNTTGKATGCSVSLKVSGPLQITGEKVRNISLNPNAEKEVLFRIFAKSEIGAGKIEVEAKALNETFLNTTDITIRPASPLLKENGSRVIQTGKTTKISMDSRKFIPSSLDYKLVVSKSPMVQFNNSLMYLVRYPYGCIEQTVSGAFPQLYFTDLARLLLEDAGEEDPNPAYNVQSAIERIRAMQLYSGALTFWPGGGTETWWGSVYAAHFLLEAQKAGYDVEQKMLDLLYKYLRMRLKKREFITYFYNYNQKRQIVPKEVAYSLYVLALAGKADISSMNYHKSNLQDLSLDSKYLLAAAYALTGDKEKYKQILPVVFEGEKANKSFGGSFYSYLRDEAIALNVLLEIDPQNPQIGIMARHVSEELRTQRYLNTQERTFGYLAMGKLARIAGETDVKVTVKSGGKVVGKMDNNTVRFDTKQLGETDIILESEGNGQFYCYWEIEGISTDGSYLEEDSYIEVRKKFYDRYGGVISTNRFEQNDLVLVEIAISSMTSQYVENVAITDILPAGFEIENPRLTELPSGMRYPNRRSHAEYMDVRDDRINLFVTASPSVRYYYYLVRAVSPGVFQMGPVGADAMYNGEYHSYNGAGVIRITKK